MKAEKRTERNRVRVYPLSKKKKTACNYETFLTSKPQVMPAHD